MTNSQILEARLHHRMLVGHNTGQPIQYNQGLSHPGCNGMLRSVLSSCRHRLGFGDAPTAQSSNLQAGPAGVEALTDHVCGDQVPCPRRAPRARQTDIAEECTDANVLAAGIRHAKLSGANLTQTVHATPGPPCGSTCSVPHHKLMQAGGGFNMASPSVRAGHGMSEQSEKAWHSLPFRFDPPACRQCQNAMPLESAWQMCCQSPSERSLDGISLMRFGRSLMPHNHAQVKTCPQTTESPASSPAHSLGHSNPGLCLRNGPRSISFQCANSPSHSNSREQDVYNIIENHPVVAVNNGSLASVLEACKAMPGQSVRLSVNPGTTCPSLPSLQPDICDLAIPASLKNSASQCVQQLPGYEARHRTIHSTVQTVYSPQDKFARPSRRMGSTMSPANDWSIRVSREQCEYGRFQGSQAELQQEGPVPDLMEHGSCRHGTTRCNVCGSSKLISSISAHKLRMSPGRRQDSALSDERLKHVSQTRKRTPVRDKSVNRTKTENISIASVFVELSHHQARHSTVSATRHDSGGPTGVAGHERKAKRHRTHVTVTRCSEIFSYGRQ
eukprot:jgi/Ulvmu1/3217/UM015_0258.1